MRATTIYIPSEELESYENMIKSNISIDNDSGCWNWKGYLDDKGYGKIYKPIIGKIYRISYTVFRGLIPEGLFVMHLCNNPSCCNTDHLKCGTHEENMKYMVECGRTEYIRKRIIEYNDSLTKEERSEIYRKLGKEHGRKNILDHLNSITKEERVQRAVKMNSCLNSEQRHYNALKGRKRKHIAFLPEVISLHNEGLSISEISRKVDLSYYTIKSMVEGRY